MSKRFELEKINNYQVQLPKVGSGKEIKWKGKNLFDVQFWNFAIIGKKKSGKTSLIYTLIKDFCTKKTIVLFFVSTFHKDNTYKVIRDYLDEKKIIYQGFTELKTDGVDNVQCFLEANKGEPESDSDSDEEIKTSASAERALRACNFGIVEKKESKKTKKKFEPEYILVFDDLSDELQSKTISALCKKNRHFRCKVILSTQSVKDIISRTIAQMDYVALFKHLNEESIQTIYERLEPNISFKEFLVMYKDVTSAERKDGLNNYLLFDIANETFRVNLDKKIKIYS